MACVPAGEDLQVMISLQARAVVCLLAAACWLWWFSACHALTHGWRCTCTFLVGVYVDRQACGGLLACVHG